jgi:predicted RNA binding protein YcfA (HicA-like mRNA interferase family)
MAKLPRGINGKRLALALQRLGYARARRSGDHLRLTTHENGEHHVTVPDHRPLKSGTLHGILRDVARHHGLRRDELLRRLFDKSIARAAAEAVDKAAQSTYRSADE